MVSSMAYLKQECHTKISYESPLDTSTVLFRFVYVRADKVNWKCLCQGFNGAASVWEDFPENVVFFHFTTKAWRTDY